MNATPHMDRGQKLLQDHPALLLISGHKESGLCAPEFFFIKEVHDRAEAMTPLLQEILDFQPSPHWRK
jgi:hypothetical protein